MAPVQTPSVAASATILLAEEDDFAVNEEWLKWFPKDRQPAMARSPQFERQA